MQACHCAMNSLESLHPKHTRVSRASRACFSCRNRKIRCNVSTVGVPCAGCSSAELKCSINSAKKTNQRTFAKERQSIPTGLHVFELETGIISPGRQSELDDDAVDKATGDVAPQQTLEDTISRIDTIDQFLATAPQALDFDLGKHLSATMRSTKDFPAQGTEVLYQESGSGSLSSIATTQNDQLDLRLGDHRVQQAFWSIQDRDRHHIHKSQSLPGYIQPIRDQLDPEDVRFLEQKKAFAVPHRSLQDELLFNYTLYVHPFLPVLDLEDFTNAISDNVYSHQISLILFQAVMFCAVPFASMRLLEAEGFDNRERARLKFFEKVRLLFDFNVELNPMTLIRTTILMTCWYDGPEDTKGRWHWLQIALSYANEIGLNRNNLSMDFSPSQQRSRRRLWWCCYIRDRLVSLTDRRPCHIRDEDVEIPLLCADDLETRFLTEVLRRNNVAATASQVHMLSELCIEKVRLCTLFGQVLRSLYVPRGHRRHPNSEIRIVLIPQESDRAAVAGEVVRLDHELGQWTSRLHSRMRGKECDVLRLHRDLLDLVYHSICSMVHRPQVGNGHGYVEGSAARTLRSVSLQRLRDAAQETTNIARSLMDDGLIERLAPIGITTLLFAGMHHISDMCCKSTSAPTSTSVRAVATLFFDHTLQCLYRLRHVYGSARHAIGLLRIVHESKKISCGSFPIEKRHTSAGTSPSQIPLDGRGPALPTTYNGVAAQDVSAVVDEEMGSLEKQSANPQGSGLDATSSVDSDTFWNVNLDWDSIINLYSPSATWPGDALAHD